MLLQCLSWLSPLPFESRLPRGCLDMGYPKVPLWWYLKRWYAMIIDHVFFEVPYILRHPTDAHALPSLAVFAQLFDSHWHVSDNQMGSCQGLFMGHTIFQHGMSHFVDGRCLWFELGNPQHQRNHRWQGDIFGDTSIGSMFVDHASPLFLAEHLVDSSGSFMSRLRIFMMVGVGKGMELMTFDSGFGHIFVKLLKHIHVIQDDYPPNPDFSGVELTNQLPKRRKSPALTMGCSFVRAATAVAFCHLLQDRDGETLSELGMRSPSLGCELYIRSDSIIPSKLLNPKLQTFLLRWCFRASANCSKRPWVHLVSSGFYDPLTLMKHWECFWTR